MKSDNRILYETLFSVPCWKHWTCLINLLDSVHKKIPYHIRFDVFKWDISKVVPITYLSDHTTKIFPQFLRSSVWPYVVEKSSKRWQLIISYLRNSPDMPPIEFTRHKQKQNRSTAIILKALLKLPITTKPETSLTSEEGKPLILRYERITHQKARTACWSGWLCRYSARLKSIAREACRKILLRHLLDPWRAIIYSECFKLVNMRSLVGNVRWCLVSPSPWSQGNGMQCKLFDVQSGGANGEILSTLVVACL